jgi:hypothetical protein
LSAGETALAIDRPVSHTYADKCLLGVDVIVAVLFLKNSRVEYYLKKHIIKKKPTPRMPS